MTDETTHLRALLADATARAERAERTLTEALTRLPSTWGPPEVLRHLLDKAGRCDQAEVRAEHAERENEKLVARLDGCLARGTAEETRANAALAACAELRAALEEAFAIHQRSECAAPPCTCTGFEATRALLSRPDLGAGWASPEDTAQMVGALQMVESDGEFDSLHEVTRKFVVDVLALLKRGGG